jgi:hypothetical protein
MDGRASLIGARITMRVDVEADLAVSYDGRIDTAEEIGDGIVRISGAITTGGRFVLVTDAEPSRSDVLQL